MKERRKVYIASMVGEYHGGCLEHEVLCVSETLNEAFRVVRNDDYMKRIREETMPGIIMKESSSIEDLGVDENGSAWYSKSVYAYSDDMSTSCSIHYYISEKELA